MEKRSLIACSLTPACFHHDRSKSRMSMSCWVSSAMPVRLVRRPLTMVDLARLASNRWSEPSLSDDFGRHLWEQASGEVCLGDPADSDPVGRLAHREAFVGGHRVHL